MSALFKTNDKWGDKKNSIEFRSLSNKPNLVKIAKKKKPRRKKIGVPIAVEDKSNEMEEMEVEETTENKTIKSSKLFPPQIETGITKTKSSFENKLKDTLKGGRFRFINEQLYTITSQEAKHLFSKDKESFDAYHEGYRMQVEKWPINPLNKIIKMIKKLPKDFVIGDFGCGEGVLAKSIPNKVFSIDLVSARDDIIACDMANTPLSTKSLDVAVYCLSLMGVNLNDCLLEANRLLKPNGQLYIAEIASRFEDVRKFIKSLELCGFSVIKKDITNKVFYFFQFKKIQNVDKNIKLPPFSLNPCLYRKR